MRSKLFLGLILTSFFVSGCGSVGSSLQKERYFAPTIANKGEIIRYYNYHYMRSSDCWDCDYVFTSLYGTRIKDSEIFLEVFDDNPHVRILSMGLMTIFPFIPTFLVPNQYMDETKDVVVRVEISHAEDVHWDITKCVMILPDGQRVSPEEDNFPFWDTWEHREPYTAYQFDNVYIFYSVPIKEVDSFHLILDGLTVGTKKIEPSEISFKKKSRWSWMVMPE